VPVSNGKSGTISAGLMAFGLGLDINAMYLIAA
jgi:hypothetical protein